MKAICSTCNEVDFDLRTTTISIIPGSPSLNTWAFTCTVCGARVNKYASPENIALLSGAGVKPDVLDLPAEILEHHNGPALSDDDLRSFRDALWLDGDHLISSSELAPVHTQVLQEVQR